MKVLQLFLLFALLLTFHFTKAQENNVPLSNEITNSYLSETEKTGFDFHSAVKPYIARELNQLRPHSVYNRRKISFWDNQMMTEKQATADTIPNDRSLSVFPVCQLGYAYDFAQQSTFYSLGGGAGMELSYKKLAAGGTIITNNSSYVSYLGTLADSMHILPGSNWAHPTKQGFSTTMGSFYVAYSPHRFFQFQAGFGKNFWGDGYRSLLLSDNAYNYPYLRISTTFWHIKYVNLFAMMQDVRFSDGHAAQFVRKYISAHYLDWTITRRFSLGVYESVIWQAKDTLLNRGFDINYLNPFVFYRPVEYALGSSDNVLIGLNTKLKITDHYQLYGQAILDEFLLSQMFGDSTGWWANKYGFQLGAKAIDAFGIENLQLQAEWNYVRPFTYSHGSVTQNYGHYNQSLAHPLGANFKEWSLFARYTVKRFQLEEQITASVFGTDSTWASFGGNIYQSYRNRYQDYHNVVGQGVKNNLLYHQFKFSWVIEPKINLRLFFTHVYRVCKNEYQTEKNHFIQLGLSTNLWNVYNDR